MKIGVLAFQGDFAEHIAMLKRLKVETAEVRLPEHLKGLDGLIIPGGESTTIGKLAVAIWLDGAFEGIWAAPRDLGNVCGRHLFIEGCQPRPAPARPDGYQSGAQCLWPPGRFLRSRPRCSRAQAGNGTPRTIITPSSSARRSSSRWERMQRSSPPSQMGGSSPPNRDTSWLHPSTRIDKRYALPRIFSVAG
jgi:hypothetical protein